MLLGTKVDFSLHLKNEQSKVNNTIGVLCKYHYHFQIICKASPRLLRDNLWTSI